MTWKEIVNNDPFHENSKNKFWFLECLMDSLNITEPNLTMELTVFKTLVTISRIRLIYDPKGNFKPVTLDLDVINGTATMDTLHHTYARFDTLDASKISDQIKRLYDIVNGKDL